MDKLELEGNEFWVLVGKKISLYSKKQDAVSDIKEILPKNPDATIAKVSYDEKEEGKGTFNVEPVSWKDIAVGMVSELSKEE